MVFLVCPGTGMDKEFRSSVYGEYYSYFLGLSKEARQMEMAKLAFHTRWVPTILASRATGP